jgi:methionyl-tRNA formyltransferase
MPERVPYLLFGSPPIGDLAAKFLLASPYPPAAVISDTKLTLDEQLELVEKHKVGFILVVGYGKILKQALLDSVCGQVLNIHPSLLPLYRGPAPVVQALLDGQTETGVSLMEIDAEMDHGPVLAQDTIPLSGTETPSELYAILTHKGVQQFLDTIGAYLAEELDLLPQDHTEATYSHFIKKEDGLLTPGEDAAEMERKVRAFQGWPGTWVVLEDGKRLIIHSALVKEDRFIPTEVQLEGGKRMPFASFAAGRRQKPEELLETLFPE